eukprot:2469211-Rhodomonas_salina.4
MLPASSGSTWGRCQCPISRSQEGGGIAVPHIARVEHGELSQYSTVFRQLGPVLVYVRTTDSDCTCSWGRGHMRTSHGIANWELTLYQHDTSHNKSGEEYVQVSISRSAST